MSRTVFVKTVRLCILGLNYSQLFGASGTVIPDALRFAAPLTRNPLILLVRQSQLPNDLYKAFGTTSASALLMARLAQHFPCENSPYPI